MSSPVSADLGIPSGAIALMAWNLAGERTPGYSWGYTDMWGPITRALVEADINANPVSAEYYRIIDRIARGEKP